MSLECQPGREAGMFEETPERAARLLIDSPVLSESKFRKLIALGNDDANFAHHVIDINYAPSQYSLEGAIQHICDEAVAAVRAGKVILVLSDRPLERDELPVHALPATDIGQGQARERDGQDG